MHSENLIWLRQVGRELCVVFGISALCLLVAGVLTACHRSGTGTTLTEERTQPQQQATAGEAPSSTPVRPALGVTPAPLKAIASPNPVVNPNDIAPQTPPPLKLDAFPPAWEKQLADSTVNLDAPHRARTVFAMMPNLPPQAIDTAVHLAIRDLSDADYPTTALPVIVDAKTHGQVLSVLFSDLLARPNAVSLPALITIAATPNHPFAPAALDDLRLLLGADFGSDWQRWNAAVQAKLTRTR